MFEPSYRCDFNLPNEDVVILFSGPSSCTNAVPADTVLLIERELKHTATFEALGLSRKRFKSFDPSWPRKMGYTAYIDEKAGLLLKAFNGQLFQIDYIPRLEERVRCPSFYRKPKAFVDAIFEHAPIVNIACPERALIPGEKIVLTAYHRSGLRVLFTWQVTGGRILERLGRRSVLLDTSGLDGRTITVAVEMNDGFQHTAFDSCKLKITAPTQK